MSIKFRKFNSIEKTDKQDFIDSIYVNGFDKDEWVVTEKLHGSNLSLWYDYDKDEVHVGKRSSFLKTQEKLENFFRADIIKDKYEDAIREFGRFRGSFVVYGEMVGGHFVGRENETDLKPVQTGVSYTPDREFFAFDMAILDEDGDPQFYDWSKIRGWCMPIMKHSSGYHIKTVPHLYEGTFEECLDFCEKQTENDYESKVPKKLGFESPQNNVAEGFVLKPNKHRKFVTGKRVIFKFKHPKFQEKAEKGKKKERKGPQFTEKGQELFDTLCSYVTMNRLHNLISKEGEVDDKNFGKFIGMLNKDVLDDFMKDHGSELEQLDKDERKNVQKQVGAKSKELLINYRKGE